MPAPGVDRHKAFKRSFDFSKFPNLQEVNFGFKVGSTVGGLPWIPTALSSLRPATSPHLSTILLDLAATTSIDRPVETLVKDTGNDLQRVADEFTRIEREFEGAVSLTVLRDSGFEVALGELNVRFPFRGVDVISWSY